MPQTIAEVIDEHARQYPERPSIVGSDFAPLSYRELAFKIAEVGEWLRTAGVDASSRVGLVLPRGPEAALLGVAIAAHAISFPLNPALSEAELDEQLARVNPDAVVLPGWTPSNALAPAQARGLGIFHASRAAGALPGVGLTRIRQVPVPRQESGRPSSCSVSVIQSSSGTTGTAKLILVTHANLLDVAAKMRNWFGLSPDDRCACMLPVHSGFGFKVALIAPLLTGGSVVITNTERPEDVAAWVSDLHPTWFTATPTFLHAVLDRLHSRSDEKLEHSLRFVASTTSYLPEAVRTGLEALLGIPVLEFYGLREAGIVAANPAPPARRKSGSVGLIPPNDVAIRDLDGQWLPAGGVGEVVVRGPGVSPGYIEDLEIGRDTVSDAEGPRNEWLSTGDLGSVDPDGFLAIVGRAKEIINRGGEKISPYEVERALLLHPSVREAGAFSVPHPRLGENVAAAVVLHPATKTTPAQLREFLHGHLVPSKVPQQVFVLDALPRGSTGKIARSQLSEAAANRALQATPAEDLLQLQILEMWRRLIGRRDIGIDDNFFEAGGDSLLATRMLLELESAVHQPIPQSELRRASTIRQLAAAVMRAIPATDDLMTLVAHGSKTPFFFCHADDYTRGFYALKLADLLGPDQPVFLLHPFRDFDTQPELTMEAMARAYVPQMLAIHPSGSFRLGGFCIGGLLAWEIAHQLAQAGREVDFVVLIDSVSLNSRRVMRAAAKALRLLARVTPEHMGEQITSCGMRTVWGWAQRIYSIDRHIVSRAIDKISHAGGYEDYARGDPPTEWMALEYSRIILSNYLPPALDSAVFCLICEQYWRARRQSPSPWNGLAREVYAQRVPGGHLGCISTHIGDLAKALQRLLSNDRGGKSTVSDRAELNLRSDESDPI